MLAILGLIGIGIGRCEHGPNMALKGTVADLNNHVLENWHTINLLTKGLEKLSEESDAIIDYVHEEAHGLYQVIEGVRCNSYNRDMELSARIALLAHKTYLHTRVTAALNAALTGTLTPEVLGMKGSLQVYERLLGLESRLCNKNRPLCKTKQMYILLRLTCKV